MERARARRELLLDRFWDEGALAPLRDSYGCYVFAIRRAKGEVVPQYAGLTRKRFDNEVFNRANLLKYRKAMGVAKRVQPVLFLIVPPHGKGKVSRKYIGELETFLIQAGSVRNPEFSNVNGVPRPKCRIRGVTGRGTGKPPAAARKLPVGVEGAGAESEAVELGLADPDPVRVRAAVQPRLHGQPRGGPGGGDELDDDFAD